MNDLVQRLLAAIDALEQANRVYPDSEEGCSGWVDWETGRNLDESWHTLGCGSYFGSQAGGGDRCECGVPEAVRRRCAADRKIVARHSPAILHAGGGADYFKTTRVCSSCEPNRQFPETSYPCPTILALAEGYGVEVSRG